MKIHTLFIYTRDCHGDESVSNAIKLAALSLDNLNEKYKQYLLSHRAEDDYLDDETFSDCVQKALDKVTTAHAPELNSAYTTEYFELDI